MAVQRMRHAGRRRFDDGAAAKGEAAVADAIGIGHEREAGEAEVGKAGDAGLARGDQPVMAAAIRFPPIAQYAAAEERRHDGVAGDPDVSRPVRYRHPARDLQHAQRPRRRAP